MSPLVWAAPGKSFLDKATLETYVRHIDLFRGDVAFKIDDPKPSKYLPGFSEVLVHLIFNGVEKDEFVLHLRRRGRPSSRATSTN